MKNEEGEVEELNETEMELCSGGAILVVGEVLRPGSTRVKLSRVKV